MTPISAAQRLPLSPTPVAPAISPVISLRSLHVPDPSGIYPSFPLRPPLLSKTVAKKSKSFKHRK